MSSPLFLLLAAQYSTIQACCTLSRSSSQSQTVPALQAFVRNKSLKLSAAQLLVKAELKKKILCMKNTLEMRLDLVLAFFQDLGLIPERSYSSVNCTFPGSPREMSVPGHSSDFQCSSLPSLTTEASLLTMRMLWKMSLAV